MKELWQGLPAPLQGADAFRDLPVAARAARLPLATFRRPCGTPADCSCRVPLILQSELRDQLVQVSPADPQKFRRR